MLGLTRDATVGFGNLPIHVQAELHHSSPQYRRKLAFTTDLDPLDPPELRPVEAVSRAAAVNMSKGSGKQEWQSRATQHSKLAVMSNKPTALVGRGPKTESCRLLFSRTQALSGHTCSLDAAADAKGDKAHCTTCCSPADAFKAEPHTGHVLSNAPFTLWTTCLQQSLHCGRSNST